MEEKNFSSGFVLKVALLVMCASVIVTLVLSVMVFHSYFSELYSGYGKLFAVDSLIDSNYYGEYDRDTAEYEACKGLVKSLGDPYAGYYSKKDLEMLMGSISSDYVGIGISVSVTETGLYIEEITKDAPAEKAGLLPGDFIIGVDDKNISDIGGEEALKIVKTGKVGTKVLLVVDRSGELMEFSVERAELYTEPVEYKMLRSGIAYIRIEQFNTDTGDRFAEVLKEIEAQNAKGIVLDLRDNPGGEAKACEMVADALLDEGVMYYSVNKGGDKETVHTEDGSNNLPLAVLVNGGTASASELVTGALKDTGRGYIIGENTYGKGVIQGIFTTGSDSALKITVAEYFTPSGYAVNKNGIEPDMVLKPCDGLVIGDLEQDNQLLYAVEYLEKQLDE